MAFTLSAGGYPRIVVFFDVFTVFGILLTVLLTFLTVLIFELSVSQFLFSNMLFKEVFAAV